MARPSWSVALSLAVAAGCGGSSPAPSLLSVEPGQGFADRSLRLLLRGDGFVPSYRIDPASGQRVASAAGFSGRVGEAPGAPLSDFTWRGPTELSATLEAGLPPGAHAVTIQDPRGERAILPEGFVALGSDTAAPVVSIERPPVQALVAAGTRLAVRLVADDGPGSVRRLRWQAQLGAQLLAEGDCPVQANAARVACEFDLVVPDGAVEGATLELRAVAVDEAPDPNSGEAIRSFLLGARPTVLAVMPAFGGIAGGTDVVVRGSGFLPGSRVLFGRLPLVPNGGLRVDSSTITGRTPAQPRGAVLVTVETPVGEAAVMASFDYRPAPSLDSVQPATVPAVGNVLLRVRGVDFTPETRIFVGVTLASATPLGMQERTGQTEIRGVAPPGAGRATVWAVDPTLGWDALPNALTWIAPGPGEP
jgi:hypothetical protein